MAAPARAHGSAPLHQTKAPAQQRAVATGVAPRFARAQSLPPMVRRSFGRLPTATRYSSPGTVRSGRRGPEPIPDLPHRRETVLVCRSSREDPHRPPQKVGIFTPTKSQPRRAMMKFANGPGTLRLSRTIRNAKTFVHQQIAGLQCQTQCLVKVIIIDSKSDDGSPDTYRAAGYQVISIPLGDFDHGATRNLGLAKCDSDVAIYMTQDAILNDVRALELLCQPFSDARVGIVYGRQLSRTKAGPIEQHARGFNYPPSGSRREWPDARGLGIKAVFTSNAFAAYRTEALRQIGGFIEPAIMSEDHVAASRMLLDGWAVVYEADATVEHSHGYSLLAEFRRFFDHGVSHVHYASIFQVFSQHASGEGRRFVMSELTYLLRFAPHRIPEAVLRSVLKLTGYHLGLRAAMLPMSIKRRRAMHPRFFERGKSITVSASLASNNTNSRLKVLLDISLATLGLILLSFPLLLIALVVKCASRSPSGNFMREYRAF